MKNSTEMLSILWVVSSIRTSQVAQWQRRHLPEQEMQVWSLGREDPLEEEMATH